MSDKASEPAWLTKLAAAGMNAARDRQYRDRRLEAHHGAASEGRRLSVWACTCGWSGGMRDLKAGAGGLTCPACGGASGLRATAG